MVENRLRYRLNWHERKTPAKSGSLVACASKFKSLRTYCRYARGELHIFPNQSGEDIDAEMKTKRVGLIALALVAKTDAKIMTSPPTPQKSLQKAQSRPEFLSYCRAHDEEIDRNGLKRLNTWECIDYLPPDRQIPYHISYKAKINQYGCLEKHKARLAMRGDRMRPGVDFEETRTTYQMPSQAGRCLLILAGVAEGHSFQSLDIYGAYMKSPNDPNLRVLMAQPKRSDGTCEKPEKVCFLRLCRAKNQQTKIGIPGGFIGLRIGAGTRFWRNRPCSG